MSSLGRVLLLLIFSFNTIIINTSIFSLLIPSLTQKMHSYYYLCKCLAALNTSSQPITLFSFVNRFLFDATCPLMSEIVVWTPSVLWQPLQAACKQQQGALLVLKPVQPEWVLVCLPPACCAWVSHRDAMLKCRREGALLEPTAGPAVRQPELPTAVTWLHEAQVELHTHYFWTWGLGNQTFLAFRPQLSAQQPRMPT